MPEFQAVLVESMFEEAYSTGMQRTIRLLQSMGAEMELAEEFAQAAWVRGWEKKEQLRNPEILCKWINAIAINIFRQSFRNLHAMEPMPIDEYDPNTFKHFSHNPFKNADRLMDAHRLMGHVSKSDAEILWRHYALEKSSGEIAEDLRVTLGIDAVSVRVRILRAKRKIAKQRRISNKAGF